MDHSLGTIVLTSFVSRAHAARVAMVSFYSVLEAAVLVLNALAILHEQRFLAKGAPRPALAPPTLFLPPLTPPAAFHCVLVGLSSQPVPSADPFGAAETATGGVRSRLASMLTAVRLLLRGAP